MSWAHEELARRRRIYESAVERWRAARDAGDLLQEEDTRERAAGVRWRAATPVGRAALSGFQLAKSELDHAQAQVQREAGNTECPTCPRKPAEDTIPEPDSRLPPERDEDAVQP